jgi:hypothetical protein
VNERKIRVWMIVIGIVALLGAQLPLTTPSSANVSAEEESTSLPAASKLNTYYLPGVVKNFPYITSFGADLGAITAKNGLYEMRQAGASWLRRAGLKWSAVEGSKSARSWEALAAMEKEMIAASSQGMKLILIVYSTPGWAQKTSPYSCGPVKEEELSAFANFMFDAVSRYSKPPYNVKYWELWNEPDVPPAVVKPDSIFGCWGVSSDPYYGGGYYADMLKAVYPVMKSADPEAQVLVGGLLLDCNPNLEGKCGQASNQPRFLEGILRHNGQNDGGNYFDGVSFHAYDFYGGDTGAYGSAKWNSSEATGPVVIAKADYINSLLNHPDFGAPGKFLMNTETALICGGSFDPPGQSPCDPEPTSKFELTKAYYVPQVYAAGQALGLRASIWYYVFGWRNSDLLNDDLTKRPAYKAYAFAREKLLNASFQRKIEQFPSIMGYEFKHKNRVIWVIWSTDRQTHDITLDQPPDGVFGPLGGPVEVSNPLQVGVKPLYLEWQP